MEMQIGYMKFTGNVVSKWDFKLGWNAYVDVIGQPKLYFQNILVTSMKK